ncbi:hypothetical protein ACU80P_22535 [Pandoraea sputorum]
MGLQAAAEIAVMKKRDAVKHAEKLLADTGWLPKMMRAKNAAEVVKPTKPGKPAAAPKKGTNARKATTKPAQPKTAPVKTAVKKPTKPNGGTAAKPATKTTSR